MADAIGPGDTVICINAAGFPDCVRVGATYFVEDVAMYGAIPCLILLGVVHPTRGFRKVRADCFRPYQGPEQAKRKSSEPTTTTRGTEVVG